MNENKKRFSVNGKIVTIRTEFSIAGLRIEALDKDLIFDDFVGEAISDADGRFTITFDRERFAGLERYPDLFFRVYQGDKLIRDTRDSLLCNVKDHEVEIMIEVDIDADIPSTPPASPFSVSGTVREADGRPVADITVRAFDRDLRREHLLGECLTGGDGAYVINYRAEQLKPKTKQNADLIVRAYRIAKRRKSADEIASSGLICKAPARHQVDLVAGNVELRGFSEMDAVTQRVTAYLGDAETAALTREDIDYLECSAGVDRRQLATLIVAHRLQNDTNVPAWLFYALGRQGMNLNLAALQAQSLKQLRETMQRAMQANIVAPLADEGELDAQLEALREALIDSAFKTDVNGDSVSLGAVLATGLVAQNVQRDFLNRYLNREDSLEQFWKTLEADQSFDDAAREDLRFTLHLGMLTQYQLPLLNRLRVLRQQGEVKSLRDLAAFNRARWRQLLEADDGDITLPDSIPGANAEERLNHYISTLREPVEGLFPSDSLRFDLLRDADTPPPLKRFLDNTADFDFYWSDIETYATRQGGAAFAGIAADERAAVIENLKTQQRLLRIAPRADQVKILRHIGFHSARAIAQTSRRKFVQQFKQTAENLRDNLDSAYFALPQGDAGGDAAPVMVMSGRSPEELAHRIYNQSSSKAMTGLQYVLNAHAMETYLPFAVGGSQHQQNDNYKDFIQHNPDLETLFGSLSFCECQHCRSVYSPAAYFVDLMHWLDNLQKETDGSLKYKTATQAKTIDGTTKAPIGVLLNRRPDLEHILLTCENTNTPLPYIDLINEVLESFTYTHLNQTANGEYEWSPAAVAGKTLQARDTGKIGAEELRAVPQYLIPEVYEYLAYNVFYPMTLPFNRALATVRDYLGHLGIQRADLMQTFQKDGKPTAQQQSIERLGLDPLRFDIITGNASNNVQTWQYYGYESEAILVKNIVIVTEFLARTGITLDDLIELLKTRFINPKLNDVSPPGNEIVRIELDEQDPCDITLMRLINLTPQGNPSAILEKAHRFLRLWRALGWSMAELDRAITVFGGALDAQTVENIEVLHWLHGESRLSLAQLMALWSDIDTWNEERLYDRLFLRGTLMPVAMPGGTPDLPQSLFALNPTRTELVKAGESLIAHLPAVFAALEMSASDYEAIQSLEPVLAGVNVKLTLTNLSRLYRYAVLARGLKLRVRDVVSLLKLADTGLDPFNTASPQAAREFVKLAFDIRQSGFSIPLINYLFRHEEEPTKHPAPTRSLIDNALKSLTQGLQKIHLDTQLSEDPLGDRLRKLLEQLQGLLSVNQNNTSLLPPQQVTQLIDVLNLSKPEPTPDTRASFVKKLHNTLMNDLDSSFIDPVNNPAAWFAPLAPNETAAQRFDKNILSLENVLLPWLRDRLQRSLIIQTLATALGQQEEVMLLLLEQLVHSTAQNPAQQSIDDFRALINGKGEAVAYDVEMPDQPPVKTFILLFKAAQLVQGFALTAAELEQFPQLSKLNLNNLPPNPVSAGNQNTAKALFANWRILFHYVVLRNSLPKSEKHLLDFLYPDSGKKQVEMLSEVSGWDMAVIDLLLKNKFKIDEVNDLLRMQQAVALFKRSGATVQQLVDWAQMPTDAEQAKAVIETVKAHYDRSRWLEVARALNDPLRERQRDALLDLLTARMTKPHPLLKQSSPLKDAVKELQSKLNKTLGKALEVDGLFGLQTLSAVKEFQTINGLVVDGIVGLVTWSALDRQAGDSYSRNQLLEHFLIDVEMSSCMLTSRIKQAGSSVQLFVQRCLLNLETDVAPVEIDAEQWQWRKNYRVWEANRKVFMYPENWIEPELRDDKTPFFKELETELLQNELTDDTVETALINYLYKLDEVARLDIRGFCKEEIEENGSTKEIYHVFGRTWNPPYVYYYRRGIFPKNGPLADEWTPWERVDVDIEGDQIIAIVYESRLYLFWPLFREKPDKQNGNQADAGEQASHWELQIAWSYCEKSKPGYTCRWSAKQVSNVLPQEIKAGNLGGKGNLNKFRFLATIDNGALDIQLYSRQTKISPDPNAIPLTGQGAFLRNSCADSMIPGNKPNDNLMEIPLNAETDFQSLDISGGLLQLMQDTIILKSSPALLRFTPPADRVGLNNTGYPFFIQDKAQFGKAKNASQTYFARPVNKNVYIAPPPVKIDLQSAVKPLANSNIPLSGNQIITDPIHFILNT